MPAIVLLPGLDGTGTLLLDVAAALGTEFEVIVVSYPSDSALDYVALESFVRSRLPSNQSFVLVAESFSGPIAISIASSNLTGLAGLALCCSFARCPRPTFRLLGGLIPLIRTSRLPAFAARGLLFGRWSNDQLLGALREALAKVSAAVVRARLRSVVSVDVLAKLRSVAVPMVYVRAINDRLVPASAARLIMRNASAVRLIQLEGPHCLLEVAASSVAPVVLEFVRSLGLTSNLPLNRTVSGGRPSAPAGTAG